VTFFSLTLADFAFSIREGVSATSTPLVVEHARGTVGDEFDALLEPQDAEPYTWDARARYDVELAREAHIVERA
jgi:hypothetical protein